MNEPVQKITKMKWFFYVIVFMYMSYRAVYGEVLTIEPESIEGFLKVGDHKSISCKGTNKNSKVKWLDPSGNAVQRGPGSRIFSQQHLVKGRLSASVLTITRATVADTGVYQCQSGDVVNNISVCVIDPSEFLDTPTEVTVDAGRSITLSCQAKGDPDPEIFWSRNSIAISDEESSDKYKLMTKYNIQGFEGLLTITSLEPEDSGIYTCLSLQKSNDTEDCGETKELNITVNVNHAPIFEDGNETEYVYSRSTDDVEIECSASGYPEPTYRWFKEMDDDVLFEYDKKQIKLTENNSAVLALSANQTTYDAKLKCEAMNEFGSSYKYFVIKPLIKPSKPSEVIVSDVTDTSVTLNVTWDDELLFPISAFEVNYMKVQNKRRTAPLSWKNTVESEVDVTDVDQEEGVVFVLPGLEESTAYWVRLKAKNDVGTSVWSSPAYVETLAKEDVEVTEDELEKKTETLATKTDVTDATFYGLFFAGGIFVVAFVCMFAMRMVK